MFTFNACSSDDSDIELEMFSEVIPLDFVRLNRPLDDVPSPEPTDDVPTIVIPEEPSTVEIVNDTVREEQPIVLTGGVAETVDNETQTDDVPVEGSSTLMDRATDDVLVEEPAIDVPALTGGTAAGGSEKTLFDALEESFMVDDIEKYIEGVYITQQSPYIAMKGHPTEQFIAFSNGVVRN